MRRILLVNVSAGLALGALRVMFAPFLREFTAWHIGAELFIVGAFLVGLICCLSVHPARHAAVSLLAIALFATLIEATIIALPALQQIVPNPVSYINLAEQEMLFGCAVAGPFVAAGGMLGIGVNLLARRDHDFRA